MIEKQFQNPLTYHLIKASSIIFGAIILSVFIVSGILAIFGLTNVFGFTVENYREALMILPFVLLLIHIILSLTFGIRNKRAISLYKNMDLISHPMDLIPGEKIVIPKTPCLIKAISIASLTRFPRHIIVTNFRITIGFLNSLSLFSKRKMEERLGLMNFWHPSIEKIPETPSQKGLLGAFGNMLGANTTIKDVAYGSDSGGPFVIILQKGFPTYHILYHQEARSIYDSFSGTR